MPLTPLRYHALLLRSIESTKYSLHCGQLDICICCRAKECCTRGYLDLDIGYGLCFGSLLKRMLCKGEHLQIGYITLVERLHQSVNGTVATTTQFAQDTISRDAGYTCNTFGAILLRYGLDIERLEHKRLVAM